MTLSRVEEACVSHEKCILYSGSGERIPAFEVENCVELGKLTALRFIEWVHDNPEGVISLPTGRTPEYFIRYLHYYKNRWNQESAMQDRMDYGIDFAEFPSTENLKFVQMDEFFPFPAGHQNSFCRYVKKYYIPLLNLKPKNILLIDPDQISDVENFCNEYEKSICEWGGIGFFLGGIGPDGHIAFNMSGSAHDSKTHLVHLNYPSAAAAAGSLGGIEYARDKTAITIGLGTISIRQDATIIIIAAGEGKSSIVSSSIEMDQTKKYPATAIHKLSGSRFYLTKGAASKLKKHRELTLKNELEKENFSAIDSIIYDVALQHKRAIKDLDSKDLSKDFYGRVIVKKYGHQIDSCIKKTAKHCEEKIKKGCTLLSGKTIMHIAPHHDDIMLSYYPYAINLLDDNINYFVYATSGFNSVTNLYIKKILDNVTSEFLNIHSTIFQTSYSALLQQFVQAFLQKNLSDQFEAECLIVLWKVKEVFDCRCFSELVQIIDWLKTYIVTSAPGEKDEPRVQELKGAIRETEVDRMWKIHDQPENHIIHLRSKFYTGDYFTPEISAEDIAPLLKLCNEIRPDIISLAFDPEGTGPNTHYKVLQLVAATVEEWKKEGYFPTMWGYRNVWFKFQPVEADLVIPVLEEELKNLDEVFCACFSTQKEASFPSPRYDGPFSELSIKTLQDQLKKMKILLGDSFFANNTNSRISHAQGCIFLKEMSTDNFLKQSVKMKIPHNLDVLT